MKKRLLLADDSVTIQKVVQITFSHDDYELTVVDNGDMAYEKARAHRPDLILADVFMPGKNGYELCAAIKNDPVLATVPVLLLTGTFEPFDEAKARSVGADRWIAKPFESQALIACVEDLLKLAAQPPVLAPPVHFSPPLSAPAPVETIGFVSPDLSANFIDDLWGRDVPAASTVGSSSQPVDDPFATLNQDDLWDVSGFESEGEAAAADDLWGGSFEPSATPPAEESPAAVTASGREEVDPWEADDIEILEEIDLLEPLDDFPADDLLSDPFAAGDFSFEEESVQPEVVAPTPLVTIASPEAAVPMAADASIPAALLSPDQLELIVERVVSVVISRLAGSVLEKIAWEVVPDLAETMIKEELRKIRESVAAL